MHLYILHYLVLFTLILFYSFFGTLAEPLPSPPSSSFSSFSSLSLCVCISVNTKLLGQVDIIHRRLLSPATVFQEESRNVIAVAWVPPPVNTLKLNIDG